MPPRTRNTRGNGAVGSPLALEDPARMPVAALQSELQRLGLEWRKDAPPVLLQEDHFFRNAEEFRQEAPGFFPVETLGRQRLPPGDDPR